MGIEQCGRVAEDPPTLVDALRVASKPFAETIRQAVERDPTVTRTGRMRVQLDETGVVITSELSDGTGALCAVSLSGFSWSAELKHRIETWFLAVEWTALHLGREIEVAK